MKHDSPAGINPIDAGKVVGRATPRIDGPLKVSGTAPYSYERHDIAPDAAVGFVVGSAIAKGRIAAIDCAAALAAPGVIEVLTYENAGKLGKASAHTALMLGGPDIQHYHQALALVMAETFEQARAAAELVEIHYDEADGQFDLHQAKDDAVKPNSGNPDSSTGDFQTAFAAAPVTVDAEYHTSPQSHCMMEPHASLALWHGDDLTLYNSNQMVGWAVRDVAKTLQIDKANVRVVSPYIGGGFGTKLWIRTDAVLAALGARMIGRPVKVALQRPLVPNNTTHRPATIQRVRLGAEKDGTITAIGHQVWSGNLPGGDPEEAQTQTRQLYAGANRMTALRIAELDMPEGNAMRAPGEEPGHRALEVAMDELAVALDMDPVSLRKLNDTQVHPEKPDRPFSCRRLNECLDRGAREFSWERRNPKPGQVRDGRWLVGMGVAGAMRDNLLMKSGARIGIEVDGRIVVETDMTDIGTGSYTILGQTAAEMMGVPLERVTVRLGDSSYPTSAGSGGQWGANNSTSGVYAAAMKLRRHLAEALGLDPDKAEFSDGQVRQGNRSFPLEQALSGEAVFVEDAIEYGNLDKQFQQTCFAAHFVEVGVDSVTAEVRVRRMLAVCSAGRIINPTSARSQVIGAMTMGVGSALMEELVVDTRRGLFVNHDLAQYEVPVHADIPQQEVIFLDETDPISSPMKARGVGELGLCGVGAALANAVYNATGVRVREYPITLDKLLGHLPPPA